MPATLARKVGSFLLTETMERRPELGLASYERLFPNQDTLPKGGFGNLIALLLQKGPREQGNSVFVDESLEPWPDQWAFLSGIHRLSKERVKALASEADSRGRVTGVRFVSVDDEESAEPWKSLPSRRRREPPLEPPLPANLELVLGDQIYLARRDLSAALRNRLVRLAAFQNPEFYRAQAMRLSTYGKPRIISCAEDLPEHIGLPRGCLEEVRALFKAHKIKARIRDERVEGKPLELKFTGKLRPEQETAAAAMLEHEIGVLAATTAFGKTVLAAHLIAARGVNTLVLVHRQQLMEQWVERLSAFLDIPAKSIGRLGGGRRKLTGNLDVALIQSVVRKGVVDDRVADYGHLIVDECHHLSAQSFELVARRAKARFVCGLSATVTRKDGHHPIIFMQCGPVRHRVDARRQAEARPFSHHVLVRPTGFRTMAEPDPDRRLEYQNLCDELMRCAPRNEMIRDGVDAPLAGLFVAASQTVGERQHARSAAEAFLFRRLESLAETAGLFRLNEKLPIAFDGWSEMEVDLFSEDLRLAIEIDGPQHLADPDAYRRDRRKDALLQENGCHVLRFLAEDLSKRLDATLDAIHRAVAHLRRTRPAEPR